MAKPRFALWNIISHEQAQAIVLEESATCRLVAAISKLDLPNIMRAVDDGARVNQQVIRLMNHVSIEC